MWGSTAGIIILSAMVLACNGLVPQTVNEELSKDEQLLRVRRAPQSWFLGFGGNAADETKGDSEVTSTAPVSTENMSTSSAPPTTTTKRSRSKSKSKKSHTTEKPSTTTKPSSVEPKELDATSYLLKVSLDNESTSPKPTASIPTPGPVARVVPSSALPPSRLSIPVKPKPLSAQYIEFQQKKIELFQSLLDFNKFEVAYVILQELEKIIIPLVINLGRLLGEECRSEWPHLSSLSPSRACSDIRLIVNAELPSVEEWVLRNRNLRESIKNVSRDTDVMHRMYADALKKSLNGFVHPFTYTDDPIYAASGYANSAPARPPASFTSESRPVPISFHFDASRPAPAPPTDDMTHQFVTTTVSSALGLDTAEPSESGLHTLSPAAFLNEKDGTTMRHEFANSAPSNDNLDIMEVPLRSFFGLPEENDVADYSTDEAISPKITRYITDMDSEDAVSIARSFLNKALQEGPSGNPEIFFFATNLYAASPKLYSALKNDIPSLVDTIVSKPKYKLHMVKDKDQAYALLVNSTTGMRSVEAFEKGDQKLIGGYWKFLPRSHGELFLLFNVDTETIIGAGNGWEANGLTFKNESDIIVQPFPDPSVPNVADSFLWELYLDCDKEVQTNATDSSEYENCPPGHSYLEARNEEFYNLKLTLDEDGNPALKSARTSWRLEAVE